MLNVEPRKDRRTMRTVGALRDAQKLNRRLRRAAVREWMCQGITIQEANKRAGEQFDPEWEMLERQAEQNKVPGNRR